MKKYFMSWSQADNGWLVVYACDLRQAEMMFENGEYVIEDGDE